MAKVYLEGWRCSRGERETEEATSPRNGLLNLYETSALDYRDGAAAAGGCGHCRNGPDTAASRHKRGGRLSTRNSVHEQPAARGSACLGGSASTANRAASWDSGVHAGGEGSRPAGGEGRRPRSRPGFLRCLSRRAGDASYSYASSQEIGR